jgi:hypothetical protein
MTSTGGVLIGDSVDPASDDSADLGYEERNEEQGLHRGHVRLRLHYGSLVTPWWDQINIAPGDMSPLIEGTGWSLIEIAGDEAGYGVVMSKT